MRTSSEPSERVENLEFDPMRIRQRFAAAFKPNPWIFWSDMGASAVIGWGAFAWALAHPLGSLPNVALLAVSVFALLRAALFIHELTHLKKGALPGFEIGWHALVGVPLQLPSLMYVGSHTEHHRKATFGTEYDPEYAPIANWGRFRLVRFVLGVAVVPLALPFRWGLMAPISYLFPAVRKLVVERASTLVINPDYRRPMPKGAAARRWVIQECAAGAFFWCLVIAFFAGFLPAQFFAQWVILGVGILVVNQIRTLTAHGYENEGEQVDTITQLLDSINIEGAPILTALMAPVGLRYHALHHFLPSVPYHSLGGLHRTLQRELPRDAPYHLADRSGMLVVLNDLWNHEAPIATVDEWASSTSQAG